MHPGLPNCKAPVCDYSDSLCFLKSISEAVMCPEAITELAWGPHPVWLPVDRMWRSLAMTAQYSPLKSKIICICAEKIESALQGQNKKNFKRKLAGMSITKTFLAPGHCLFPRHKTQAAGSTPLPEGVCLSRKGQICREKVLMAAPFWKIV